MQFLKYEFEDFVDIVSIVIRSRINYCELNNEIMELKTKISVFIINENDITSVTFSRDGIKESCFLNREKYAYDRAGITRKLRETIVRFEILVEKAIAEEEEH